MTTTPDSSRKVSPGLFRFAVFVTLFTLFHIKFGAMVVSTGSGMAFTDWPLARGSLWPPDMDLEDLFEHLHRIFGALLGLFTIVLLVWVKKADRRSWLVKACWWLLVLMIVQGVLGGIGVLGGSAEEGAKQTWTPFAIAHGVLGQVTLCLEVLIAFGLSKAWQIRVAADPKATRTTRKLARFALLCVFAQLIIGAVFRHTDIQDVLWLHIGMALVVSLAILMANAHITARFGEQVPGFKRLGMWIYIMLLAQLTLGFSTLAVRRFKADPSNIEYIGRSLVVSSHVFIGAGLFLMAALLLARAWRNLDPSGATPLPDPRQPGQHPDQAAASS